MIWWSGVYWIPRHEVRALMGVFYGLHLHQVNYGEAQMNQAKTFTHWFQHHLARTGLSLNEIHHRTGLARSFLTRIKQGKGFPSGLTAAHIAKVGFGITDKREIEVAVLLAVGYQLNL